MQKLLMCRICLATGVRLCSLASHLRDMFERISSMTFKTEDRRPLVLCYICHARLQNCYRLRTSCRESEELLTEMLNSGELKRQEMLSTNTFSVVSVLQLSLGPALHDSTECHVSEDISDAGLDQLNTEDIVSEAQEEKCALIEDNNQSSHLENPLDKIKEEADDFETDTQYIKLEEGNINIEEIRREPGIGWELDIAGPSAQSADNNLCPKIEKIVVERIHINDSRVGAPVSTKSTIAALKDTADATTNKRKIEVIKNEQTEIVTFKEPKIVTKKIEVEKPGTTSLILETSVGISVVNDVCEQKSTIDTSLEHNVSSVSSRKGKPFSCDTCKKCFSYESVLKNHILTHTNEKPYQCNVCKKCFTQKGNLKIHIRTHTFEKSFQCNVCKKSFTYKKDLYKHISSHPGEKLYQCNVCTTCFGHKGHLKRHIRTHSGENPYQCNVCKKCFNQISDIDRHSRTHTGEKPHQCNVCKKCFTQKGHLERHIRIHTGEKPYQCNVCKKCFTQKSDLNRHNRTHTTEKPYQCNVCKKCFSYKSVLKNHILTHTSEKPFQCNVCKKCYTEKRTLKKHIRIHSGEKPYQCNVKVI